MQRIQKGPQTYAPSARRLFACRPAPCLLEACRSGSSLLCRSSAQSGAIPRCPPGHSPMPAWPQHRWPSRRPSASGHPKLVLAPQEDHEASRQPHSKGKLPDHLSQGVHAGSPQPGSQKAGDAASDLQRQAAEGKPGPARQHGHRAPAWAGSGQHLGRKVARTRWRGRTY